MALLCCTLSASLVKPLETRTQRNSDVVDQARRTDARRYQQASFAVCRAVGKVRTAQLKIVHLHVWGGVQTRAGSLPNRLGALLGHKSSGGQSR